MEISCNGPDLHSSNIHKTYIKDVDLLYNNGGMQGRRQDRQKYVIVETVGLGNY